MFSTCAVRENADNKLDGNLGHLKPVKDRTPGIPPLDRFVVVCRSRCGTPGRDSSGGKTHASSALVAA